MLKLYLSTLKPSPNLRGENPTENHTRLLTRHSLVLAISLLNIRDSLKTCPGPILISSFIDVVRCSVRLAFLKHYQLYITRKGLSTAIMNLWLSYL